MAGILDRLKQVDWTFLLACIAWGLTTALMLYVKLRKKTESFPVLILVGIFLLYMNCGDLFKSFRLYTIACVNRRVLIHQFITALVIGFISHGYSDVFVLISLLTAIILRPGWTGVGKTGIPIVGAFLITPFRRTVVMLGLANQCFGFFTGTVLGVAMITQDQTPRIEAPALQQADIYYPVAAWAALLLMSRLLAYMHVSKTVIGRAQTFLASGFIACLSRSVALYSSPIVLVPVLAVIYQLFPGAVTSITGFIPQMVSFQALKMTKLNIFLSVMVWHVAGSLVGNYLSPQIPNMYSPEYVSQRGIAQEMFFSVMVSFISAAKPSLAWLVYLSAWLGTAGPDMVHLSSSISLGAEHFSNGRLIARLIWQTAGSFVGAGLLAPLADSDRIDFDPITQTLRTTDGKKITKKNH